MNNKEYVNFQRTYRGRFGYEEFPHGRARDERTCGLCVVPDNPSDAARSLTKNRARRVPSPRSARDYFANSERGQITTPGADL